MKNTNINLLIIDTGKRIIIFKLDLHIGPALEVFLIADDTCLYDLKKGLSLKVKKNSQTLISGITRVPRSQKQLLGFSARWDRVWLIKYVITTKRVDEGVSVSQIKVMKIRILTFSSDDRSLRTPFVEPLSLSSSNCDLGPLSLNKSLKTNRKKWLDIWVSKNAKFVMKTRLT